MRYTKARIEDSEDKELYREYSGMALYAISNNSKISKSFSDIKNAITAPIDTRSGKEITEDAAAKMGLKINWRGENNWTYSIFKEE